MVVPPEATLIPELYWLGTQASFQFAHIFYHVQNGYYPDFESGRHLLPLWGVEAADLGKKAVAAQAVSGTVYRFATGVTGGGSAKAAAPANIEELTEWLSDETARVIVTDEEEYDFTATTTTEAGCSRISFPLASGGQLYIGDLSCGGSEHYQQQWQGALNGKGLSLKRGASNVIIQGIEFTNINPEYVWGGDALDMQENNYGVWVDHCKFSLIGRMFVVSHYDGSRITLPNNEFDRVTITSATCNGNHYWTKMFIADGGQVTVDKNYFDDVSGRAPKLGQDGVTGTFQATNNYVANMEGYAFDAYNEASILVEGNMFDAVDTPITEEAASVGTFYNISTDSGNFPSLKSSNALSAFSSLTKFLFEPVDASEVRSLVTGSAGPAKPVLSGSSGSDPGAVILSTSSAISFTSDLATSVGASVSPFTVTAPSGSAAKGTASSTPPSKCAQRKRAFRDSFRV
ncbi:hypothetical protein JX265_005910 [Neoarthrinium moseri]|uniref:pectin lyase n=1 Tax=Neoarthrinium moseri TaxID=1658444 RepID=A0A9P9WNG8_9PEZI|nr:hypothetical protein JX265_005910 [Neoarthrinium moseri]